MRKAGGNPHPFILKLGNDFPFSRLHSQPAVETNRRTAAAFQLQPKFWSQLVAICRCCRNPEWLGFHNQKGASNDNVDDANAPITIAFSKNGQAGRCRAVVVTRCNGRQRMNLKRKASAFCQKALNQAKFLLYPQRPIPTPSPESTTRDGCRCPTSKGSPRSQHLRTTGGGAE